MHKKSIRKLAQLHGWWTYQSFLKRTRSYSEDQRQAWIRQQMQQTLIRAHEGTRYYAEIFKGIGFDPRTDFTGPETLTRLPLLTKDIIRERFDDLVDSRYRRLSAYAETSGTTGKPMRMLLNESYIALDYACMYEMWAQAGYRFRDPFLALRSYVPSKVGDPLWIHDKAQNTLFMSAYHFSPRTAQEYMQAIESFQPKFIRSYPSSLLVLAEYLERTGKTLPSVKGLFTASETLAPHEREAIERVFGRILFDWYGMTEPTLVAYEGADHDGLNIVWQYGHAEFLPDDSLAPGDSRLIATSLQNPVMPFIRYDTGDIVTRHVSETPETLFPRKLARVQGRKDDVILTPDGRRLPSVNFYSVFRSAPGVVRFQIVQFGASDIVVNIESTDPGFERHPAYRKVQEEMRSRFGDAMSVEYRINQRFETNRDGKTPVVLRRRANKAVEERKEYVLSSQVAWSRSRAGEDILKLDWNEADKLPSDRVREKLVSLVQDPHSIIWYPEAWPAALHQALATHHQIHETSLLATHGSDMALSYLTQCYVTNGDKVMIVAPGYDNFRAVAEQRGGQALHFTFNGDGEYPLQEMLRSIQEEVPRLIYLTNPNNPIGYCLSQEAIAAICTAAARESALVVVDEAYAEFADHDCVPLIASHANLVIVRTFSKAFGLAGLRVGYLIGDPALIETVRRVANPKHLTTFAQVAAQTVLEDWPQVKIHIEEVKQQRARFIAFLRNRGIKCFDSHGNFVLFQMPEATGLAQWLETQGILIRDRSTQLASSARVTIGGKESTDRLIAVFEEYWQTHPIP
ncbi:histidinol-phosphate aminotransferase [Prosthecobacter fusiformis]|uniref:Histidinol-phosphate aminotransferase n=1 Tax=Prosthecobacter fusiformis TaxID=48464 RepID=A0A4R7S689_9BACT|nr:aminotransferase class I/II-fold pyridoxal phosphate-dependent enzyme [Prosthecobacter fusiformis]TDU73409.1 histidinol-phosphate aminotransferase [Prosthecobacter fusiformis]